MKNLLVTGGAGFIGTNFVHYWLNQYPEDHVIVLDALTYAGNRQNLEQADKNPKFNFVHGNILDYSIVESLLTDHKINTIVHFAAESHVDRSIQGPDEFINTNIFALGQIFFQKEKGLKFLKNILKYLYQVTKIETNRIIKAIELVQIQYLTGLMGSDPG